MKSKKTIALIALLTLMIAGAAFLYQKLGAGIRGEGPSVIPASSVPAEGQGGESSETEEIRTPLPGTLSFTDPDGSTITLDKLRGKPLVINFWATWCGYCRKEMPDFLEIYQEYRESVQFVMLNVGETRAVASDFLAKNGWEDLPVYYEDLNLQMARAFGASGLPMTFFIDSEGYLAAYEPGMTNAERLRTGIGMILPAAEPETVDRDSASQEAVNPSWCTMKPVYTKIDPENAKNLIDEAVESESFFLLDVRTEAEYQEKHIPGAVLIPVDELSERAEREFPDQRSLILVYCRSGRRSEQAARMLVEMGYNHVYDFGGINDWPYETVSGSEAGA